MSTKIDSENSISRFDLLVSKPHVFKETVLYSTEKKWRPQFLSFFYLHNGSTEKPKIVGFMQILRRLRNESLFNLHDSKFKGFSSTFALIKRIMEKSVDVKLAIFVEKNYWKALSQLYLHAEIKSTGKHAFIKTVHIDNST